MACSSTDEPVEDWSLRLQECRRARGRLLKTNPVVSESVNNEPFEERFRCFRTHFLSIQVAIRRQLHECLVDNNFRTEKRSEQALRVALMYLSVSYPDSPPTTTTLRRSLQHEAFASLHGVLLRILLRRNESNRSMQYCTKAGQVLCNTITDCPDTATELLQVVTPSPTPMTIADNVRSMVIEQRNRQPIAPPTSINSEMVDCNWVDLMLTNSSHRPTLAVVVACLHNCLCATTNNRYIKQIASCQLLVSTLLRHVVSSLSGNVVTESLPDDDKSCTDEATEWIMLLLSKLCRSGYLPTLYQAISADIDTVLPEHIVLLHCVRTLVEDCRGTGESRCSLFGEESSGCYESIETTHLFIVSLYLTVRGTSRDCDVNFEYDIEDDGLRRSALLLILDILAETLTDDSVAASTIRSSIGPGTLLLESLILDLADVLDNWHDINKGKQSRHRSNLSDAQQRRVTSMVRAVGNLCFRCPLNQDRLRLTSAPPLRVQSMEESDASATAMSTSDRNGLHILLSMTSLSFACFTLREWAVVAIRAALEDCPANQAVVDQLEATQAIKSAELDEMGLRVDLNNSNGNVSVMPTR